MTARTVQGYSLQDAADFLEYDAKTIEYWLRMGHLAGSWDDRRSSWEISPQSMLDFLRQAHEPMPTGFASRNGARRSATPALAGEHLAD